MMTKKTLAALLASSLVSPVWADEKEELLKLRQEIAGEREELLNLKNTAVNLIDVFVQQGLLDKQKADSLIKKSAEEIKQPPATEAYDEKTTAEEDAAKPKNPKTRKAYALPMFPNSSRKKFTGKSSPV